MGDQPVARPLREALINVVINSLSAILTPVTELRDRKGRHICACSKDFSEALINVVINSHSAIMTPVTELRDRKADIYVPVQRIFLKL
jgi:hypothetical protein